MDGDFLGRFKNSFIAVAISLVILLIAGSLAGDALAYWRVKFPALRTFFVSPA
ncbi:MAG: hypothetical protein LBD58_00255 [Treponema sp.]|nr:hypothetical protein [Treponema sp.]